MGCTQGDQTTTLFFLRITTSFNTAVEVTVVVVVVVVDFRQILFHSINTSIYQSSVVWTCMDAFQKSLAGKGFAAFFQSRRDIGTTIEISWSIIFLVVVVVVLVLVLLTKYLELGGKKKKNWIVDILGKIVVLEIIIIIIIVSNNTGSRSRDWRGRWRQEKCLCYQDFVGTQNLNKRPIIRGKMSKSPTFVAFMMAFSMAPRNNNVGVSEWNPTTIVWPREVLAATVEPAVETRERGFVDKQVVVVGYVRICS
jgi:hypothetical protein